MYCRGRIHDGRWLEDPAEGPATAEEEEDTDSNVWLPFAAALPLVGLLAAPPCTPKMHFFKKT